MRRYMESPERRLALEKQRRVQGQEFTGELHAPPKRPSNPYTITCAHCGHSDNKPHSPTFNLWLDPLDPPNRVRCLECGEWTALKKALRVAS